MFIMLFIGGFLIFLASMGVDVFRLILKIVTRCLSGIVIIYVVNLLILHFGGNLSVSLNEFTIGVSGILGIWGIILLYALQYYFTIT